MRKVAVWSASFSAAVFVWVLVVPKEIGAVCAVAAGGAVLALRLALPPNRLRTLAVLTAAGLCAGFLWSGVYDGLFLTGARELGGQTVRLQAVVADWPTQGEYGDWQVLVRVETGRHVWTDTLLYLDGDGGGLKPGDRLETVAHLELAGYDERGQAVTYHTAKGIFLRGQAYGDLVVTSPGFPPVWTWPAWLSKGLKETITSSFPQEEGALVLAVVTGNRDNLTDSFTTSLQRTGLSHTVAVSGMHLAFLAGALSLALGRGRRRTALIVTPCVLLFMAVAGNTPSVVRAGIMILMLQAAPLLGRERDGPTSLALALMMLLAYNPYSAAHVGLQLSFAAVAGIFLWAEGLQRRMLAAFGLEEGGGRGCLRWLGRWAVSVCTTTLGAMVFTTPLAAWHFGYVSLISPLTNLLTLWAVSAVFLGGLATGLTALWVPWLGWVLVRLTLPFATYLCWVIPLFARWTLAAVTTDSLYYQAWLVLVYAVLLGAWLLPGRKSGVAGVSVCAIGFCLAVLLHSGEFYAQGFTASVLDVGQGQCVLLQMEGKTVMVDCGGSVDSPGDRAADFLSDLGESRLSLLVLTHFHADHAGGVARLLERVEVEELAVPPAETGEDQELREEILSQAARLGVSVREIEGDTCYRQGEASLTVYAPLGSSTENERGLSVLASVGETDVLLTGDMGAETEQLLLAHAQLPQVELLVVGHHGGSDSTSQELLDAIRPSVAVISVGLGNSYGHPSQETLERLDRAGAEIYRTDLMEDVTVRFRTD